MADVVLSVPEAEVKRLIDTQLKLAVVNALGSDPLALCRAIVDKALAEKTNSYDHETIFSKAITRTISMAAQKEFEAWLNDHAAEFVAVVRKRLDEKKGVYLKRLQDAIMSSLLDGSRFDVRWNVRDPKQERE